MNITANRSENLETTEKFKICLKTVNTNQQNNNIINTIAKEHGFEIK